MVPMLKLTHKLKGKTVHDIPVDATKALAPEAFRTIYTDPAGTGAVPTGVEWTLAVGAEGYDGKYEDHIFKLTVTPESIHMLETLVATAKERFAQPGLPVEV